MNSRKIMKLSPIVPLVHLLIFVLIGFWIVFVSKNILLIALGAIIITVFFIRFLLCLKSIEVVDHNILISRVIGNEMIDARKLSISHLLSIGPIAPIIRFSDDSRSITVVVVPSMMRPTLEDVLRFIEPLQNPS